MNDLFNEIRGYLDELKDYTTAIEEKLNEIEEEMDEFYEPKEFNPYTEYGISERDFH